jgi:hypothetical protein
MNYIQAYHGLPLAIVFKEDKADYYNDKSVDEKTLQAMSRIFIMHIFMYLSAQAHADQAVPNSYYISQKRTAIRPLISA